jgi:hypothetical protein
MMKMKKKCVWNSSTMCVAQVSNLGVQTSRYYECEVEMCVAQLSSVGVAQLSSVGVAQLISVGVAQLSSVGVAQLSSFSKECTACTVGCTVEPEIQNERDNSTETLTIGQSEAQDEARTVCTVESRMVCSVQIEHVDQTASVSVANPAEPTDLKCKSKLENKHTGRGKVLLSEMGNYAPFGRWPNLVEKKINKLNILFTH